MSQKSASKKKTPRPFSKQQELFIFWYTHPDQLYHGTEAARKAGYKGGDNQLAVIASQNLRKPHLAKAIREEMRKQHSAADLTVEQVLANINIGLQGAIRDRNWSAVKGFTEQQGKYLKMYSDRVEHVHSIEEVEDDVLHDLVNELVGKIDGLDLVDIGGNATTSGTPASTPGTEKAH